jgi:FtsP/CotA-like multicopper oxidase with cupredoxin domain
MRKQPSPFSTAMAALYLVAVICCVLPAAVLSSPCTPGSFRVRLADCPIQELHPRDGDTLELSFIPITVEFPLLYASDDVNKTAVWQHEDGAEVLDVQAKLVQGGVVRFQTKTFKSPGIEAAIPCPTIYWPKGGNVKVHIKNDLDRPAIDNSYRLNIHTHGLHIGPEEDNSAVVIRPTESHLYDYHLPHNHGGGTHWYHPHINTLSELQVGGGTAGMMVVEDADDGTEVPKFVLAMPEQVLVIQFVWPQRIMSISRGEAVGIVSPHRRTYVRDDLYTLEATDDAGNNVTVPETAFYYLVNGFVQPTVSFVKNQWTRLRLLHTSNGHDVHLHIEGADCKMYVLAKGELVVCLYVCLIFIFYFYVFMCACM